MSGPPLGTPRHEQDVNRARALVEESSHVYDIAQERLWEQKYKFHSAVHMRRTYRTFARARHDPLNKDPSWGHAVIANIAGACASSGVNPRDLFKGSEWVTRGEMKQTLGSVMPSLSDLQLAAVFDLLEDDRHGGVNVDKLCETLAQSSSSPVSVDGAQRWRNPIHRINRVPPATLEGWDHLVSQPCSPDGLDKHSETQTRELIERLSPTLRNTPRALRHTILDKAPRHQNFGGGADSMRFARSTWHRDRSSPVSGWAVLPVAATARGNSTPRASHLGKAPITAQRPAG